ncbi:hypothetical protein NFI96_008948, partial [Prochilodus magdalenae]
NVGPESDSDFDSEIVITTRSRAEFYQADTVIESAASVEALQECTLRHSTMLQTAGCLRHVATLEGKRTIVSDYLQWYILDRNSSVIDRQEKAFTELELYRLKKLLTRLRKESTDDGHAVGFRIPNCSTSFCVSVYVDDIVAMVSSQAEVDVLSGILNEFQVLSSAKVNWGKSEAFLVGEWKGDEPRLPDGLHWKKGGFKYLGVYLGDGEFMKKNWEDVLKRIKGWWEISETHSDEEDEVQWRMWWKGPVFLSNGTNVSAGLAILVSPGLSFSLISQKEVCRGRLFILHASIYEQEFIFVNVYAPNTGRDRAAMFTTLRNELSQYNQDAILVLGGDWNCTLDFTMDRTGDESHMLSVNVLKGVVTDNNLVDCWRIKHPTLKQFTWLKTVDEHFTLTGPRGGPFGERQSGSVATLSCHLSPEHSAVTMEIRWFKGTDCVCLYKNRQVTEGRGYEGRVSLFTQELQRGNVSLQIRDCRLSDRGDYLCQVTNGETTGECTVEVYVSQR